MRARDLLPWRDFTIETSWTPGVAAIELQKCVDKPRFLGGAGDAPFAGKTADGREFRFSRSSSYRNSFLPVIVAVVEPTHHDGARIRVRMRLHVLVMAFMGVWMTVATVVAIALLVAYLGYGQAAGLVALAFPLLGVGLVSIPFDLEARHAERLLREIYEAAPALPGPPETGEAYR